MKFPNPSVTLPLFAGLSAALVARATKDVYSDFEDIEISGVPGVTNAGPLTDYHQLHYEAFAAIHADQAQPEFQLLTYPDGNGSGIGVNGSSLTSVYAGSPVVSFKPNYASFGCFLSDKTAVAPGVFCEVQVTAFHPDGSQYPTQAICTYTGLGKVQNCFFPSTWTQVGKLLFTVIASAELAIEGAIVQNLLGSLNLGGPGTIGYYFDDFDSGYTCAAGKSVSPTSGLCV